jgi:hypothetical protein
MVPLSVKAQNYTEFGGWGKEKSEKNVDFLKSAPLPC